jgi:hypothetical protein
MRKNPLVANGAVQPLDGYFRRSGLSESYFLPAALAMMPSATADTTRRVARVAALKLDPSARGPTGFSSSAACMKARACILQAPPRAGNRHAR